MVILTPFFPPPPPPPPSECDEFGGFFSPKEKILARSPNSLVSVCQISLERKDRCKSQEFVTKIAIAFNSALGKEGL
jgi:hypothetical protein